MGFLSNFRKDLNTAKADKSDSADSNQVRKVMVDHFFQQRHNNHLGTIGHLQ